MPISDLSTHSSTYVSIAELSAYWMVSRRYLYRLVETGRLRALKLGPKSFRIATVAALEFERGQFSYTPPGTERKAGSSAVHRP